MPIIEAHKTAADARADLTCEDCDIFCIRFYRSDDERVNALSLAEISKVIKLNFENFCNCPQTTITRPEPTGRTLAGR